MVTRTVVDEDAVLLRAVGAGDRRALAELYAVHALPERWALITGPGSPAWADVQRRLVALLMIGLAAMLVVGRDPASRTLSRLLRRTC